MLFKVQDVKTKVDKELGCSEGMLSWCMVCTCVCLLCVCMVELEANLDWGGGGGGGEEGKVHGPNNMSTMPFST